MFRTIYFSLMSAPRERFFTSRRILVPPRRLALFAGDDSIEVGIRYTDFLGDRQDLGDGGRVRHLDQRPEPFREEDAQSRRHHERIESKDPHVVPDQSCTGGDDDQEVHEAVHRSLPFNREPPKRAEAGNRVRRWSTPTDLLPIRIAWARDRTGRSPGRGRQPSGPVSALSHLVSRCRASSKIGLKS